MRRQYTPKRKVPVLRISLTSDSDYNKICEVPEFKNLVLHETLVAIRDGIRKKRKTTELFEIFDTKLCFNLHKEDWKTHLTTAMNHFSTLEDYDKAIECRELMKQI